MKPIVFKVFCNAGFGKITNLSEKNTQNFWRLTN